MTKLIAPQLMQLRKEAMQQKDEVAKRTLVAIAAAFKQKMVDERLEALMEDQEVAIFVKMVKQRKESVEQFTKAGREDLVEKEVQEIQFIEEFLPKSLTEEEIAVAIEKAIQSTGASTVQDMGKVMGVLKPELNGRADMGKVSGLVRKALA